MKSKLNAKVLGATLGVALMSAVGALAQNSTPGNAAPARTETQATTPNQQSNQGAQGQSNQQGNQMCPVMKSNGGGSGMNTPMMNGNDGSGMNMSMMNMMDCCKKMGMNMNQGVNTGQGMNMNQGMNMEHPSGNGNKNSERRPRSNQ